MCTLCVSVVCVHMHMCACMRVSVCSIIMSVYMHEHTLVISIHAFGCVDVPLDMLANHHTPPFLILNLFEQSDDDDEELMLNVLRCHLTY